MVCPVHTKEAWEEYQKSIEENTPPDETTPGETTPGETEPGGPTFPEEDDGGVG